MPSRNRVPNAAELVNRSLNLRARFALPNGLTSLTPHATVTPRWPQLGSRIMMNKIIARLRPKSSRKRFYGFQLVG